MSFFKAIIPGAILTLILAGIVGNQGSDGGVMAITHKFITLSGHSYGYYWSWSTFLCAFGLCWALFAMMAD